MRRGDSVARRLETACALLGLALLVLPWVPHGCSACSRGVPLAVVVLAGVLWGGVSACLSVGRNLWAAFLASALALGHVLTVLLLPARACTACRVLLVLELAAWVACLSVCAGRGLPRLAGWVLAGGLAALPGALYLRDLKVPGPPRVVQGPVPGEGEAWLLAHPRCPDCAGAERRLREDLEGGRLSRLVVLDPRHGAAADIIRECGFRGFPSWVVKRGGETLAVRASIP